MTCLCDCNRYSQSTEVIGELLRIVRMDQEMILGLDGGPRYPCIRQLDGRAKDHQFSVALCFLKRAARLSPSEKTT
jgi:hypothetical protein